MRSAERIEYLVSITFSPTPDLDFAIPLEDSKQSADWRSAQGYPVVIRPVSAPI